MMIGAPCPDLGFILSTQPARSWSCLHQSHPRRMQRWKTVGFCRDEFGWGIPAFTGKIMEHHKRSCINIRIYIIVYNNVTKQFL